MLGSGAFLLILVLALFLILHQPKSGTNRPNSTSVDPFSHETISSPKGKTPETYGTNATLPLYLGFDKLIDRGMTFRQVGNLKYAFYNYSQAENLKTKRISIDVDHITTQHTGSQFLILFNVQFNQKNVYRVKVDYSGLTAIRLYLLGTKSGDLVYDSGLVDPQETD